MAFSEFLSNSRSLVGLVRDCFSSVNEGGYDGSVMSQWVERCCLQVLVCVSLFPLDGKLHGVVQSLVNQDEQGCSLTGRN
jgi:hypothetical protein